MMIKKDESRIVFWSFVYFFTLLASYFILRPLRDEMAIINGVPHIKWLFTGTFLAMLIIVPIFGYLTFKFKIESVLKISYRFFIANILIFYFLFANDLVTKTLPILFFIWLGIFNLFVVSLFWSFMVDIFTSDQSKRLFGIISAGGSLGAILGSLITTILSNKIETHTLFLFTVGFLFVSLIALNKVINIKYIYGIKKNVEFKNVHLDRQSLFDGVKLVFASKYLKRIALFMILSSSISTLLYFEQATIVEQTYIQKSERIAYFSRIDLITNILAITGQFFLTNKIIKKFGLSITLSLIPLVMVFGFIFLSAKTILPVIAILLIIYRAGNYILLRPGKEILFTGRSREEKYKAKNFIDTALYRCGDTLSGWIFTGLISFGLGLSTIAIIALPIIIAWGFLAFQLGKKQDSKKQEKYLNIKIL